MTKLMLENRIKELESQVEDLELRLDMAEYYKRMAEAELFCINFEAEMEALLGENS